jgi:hypothetical protein
MKNLIHKVSHELHLSEGSVSYNTVVENRDNPNNPFFYAHGNEKPQDWNIFNDIDIFVEVETEDEADYWSMAHQVYVKQL